MDISIIKVYVLARAKIVHSQRNSALNLLQIHEANDDDNDERRRHKCKTWNANVRLIWYINYIFILKIPRYEKKAIRTHTKYLFRANASELADMRENEEKYYELINVCVVFIRQRNFPSTLVYFLIEELQFHGISWCRSDFQHTKYPRPRLIHNQYMYDICE